jgi:hypothetical protein
MIHHPNLENVIITVTVENAEIGLKAGRAYTALQAVNFSAGENSYHIAVLNAVTKQLSEATIVEGAQ